MRAEACGAAGGPIVKLYVVKLCYYNCYRYWMQWWLLQLTRIIWTHKSQWSQNHRVFASAKCGYTLMFRYLSPAHDWLSKTITCWMKNELHSRLSNNNYSTTKCSTFPNDHQCLVSDLFGVTFKGLCIQKQLLQERNFSDTLNCMQEIHNVTISK